MPAHLAVLASAVNTIGTLIVIPVVVAALTALATTLVTRANDAANRRRDRYAEAIQTLVAWVEFPYRVRRRPDDNPATLSTLANLGHDLQERLACHEAWIATEHPALSRAYARTRATISAAVSPAITEAWESPPIGKAADMSLGNWGPAVDCKQAISGLQDKIEYRFGARRLMSWCNRWRRGRRMNERPADTGSAVPVRRTVNGREACSPAPADSPPAGGLNHTSDDSASC